MIQDDILKYKDESYYKFTNKIVRGKNFYLRSKYTKEIAKKYVNTNEGLQFLDCLPHNSCDENNIHAMMIGMSKDFEFVIQKVEAFLPFIDNWATCDTLASSLKVFKKHTIIIEKYVKKWLKSDKIYTVRFAIVVLLDYFLDENFKILHLNDVNIMSNEYYINMAISWYYSVALVKKYDCTIKIFENKTIKNPWVQNKAIQKALESFRITDEKKLYLKSLKV